MKPSLPLGRGGVPPPPAPRAPLLRALRWLARPSNWLCVAFVLGMIQYGSTKGKVSYPRTNPDVAYLTDAGSYVTNDHLRVAFARNAIVPEGADLQIHYRPSTSTNDADWVAFLVSDFASFSSPSNIPFANAWSNDWQVFTTWQPSPAVYTNATAIFLWHVPKTNSAITIASPLNTSIYSNERKLK